MWSPVREVRLPDVGSRDVLIRVLASGVSTGTDRWVLQGVFVWCDICYPTIPGYQACGIIVAVGSEVTKVRVGQQVAATAGQAGPDVSTVWGTHASWIVADVSDVYDATDIPPVRASFLVSGQVGLNGASRLLLPARSRVAVIGDGIIGASAALACVARDFDVLVVGRHSDRLASLRRLGLRTAEADNAEAALRAHETVGVIDTAQNDAAFASYIDVLPRSTGQLVYSGHSPGGITSWGDMAALQKQEITVHFVSGFLPNRLRATLDLMREGRLPLDHLVGRIAEDEVAARTLLADVAAGKIAPVAVAIDWGWVR